MEPLTSPSMLRGLGLLAVLPRGGVGPTRHELDVYAAAPFPQTAREKYFSGAASRYDSVGVMAAHQFDTDSTSDYLLATGLATEINGRLTATDFGRSLYSGLRAHDAGDEASAVEVVGRLNDPAVYARLLTLIDKLDDVLLVDPYLPSRDLPSLLMLPGVRRILTKDTGVVGEKQDERLRRLALALGAQPDATLRFVANGKDLHDRCVLPAHGAAMMVGTSLGGTQLTVATDLSDIASDLLRAHYQQLWQTGRELEAIRRDDESGD